MIFTTFEYTKPSIAAAAGTTDTAALAVTTATITAAIMIESKAGICGINHGWRHELWFSAQNL